MNHRHDLWGTRHSPNRRHGRTQTEWPKARHNAGMCLAGLIWNAHPRWRLVMAGNRDESHARPTAALARWHDAALLAGRDLRSGGTWMGLGPDGRAAVVTNVRDGLATPFDGPSRGALPTAFLTGPLDPLTHANALMPRALAHAPFNLILADATACIHLSNHPAPAVQALPQGVHAISNGPLDAPWPKVRHLRTALTQWAQQGHDDLQPIWAALADCRAAPDTELPDTGVGLQLERHLSPAFIRGHEYGTRSSTVLLVAHDGQARIIERRYGPLGQAEGETALDNDALA